jgi:hypothetical protein
MSPAKGIAAQSASGAERKGLNCQPNRPERRREDDGIAAAAQGSFDQPTARSIRHAHGKYRGKACQASKSRVVSPRQQKQSDNFLRIRGFFQQSGLGNPIMRSAALRLLPRRCLVKSIPSRRKSVCLTVYARRRSCVGRKPSFDQDMERLCHGRVQWEKANTPARIAGRRCNVPPLRKAIVFGIGRTSAVLAIVRG